MPLPLLRRQHQDRLPGRDGQESTAPRQSQLKTLEAGLPLLSRPTAPSRAEAGNGRPRDLLNRLYESGCGRVWLFLSYCGLTKQVVEVKLTHGVQTEEADSVYQMSLGYICSLDQEPSQLLVLILHLLWFLSPTRKQRCIWQEFFISCFALPNQPNCSQAEWDQLECQSGIASTVVTSVLFWSTFFFLDSRTLKQKGSTFWSGHQTHVFDALRSAHTLHFLLLTSEFESSKPYQTFD